MIRGLSNAEIGASPSITDNTVKTHVARVLAKLGLRDRIHAVIFGYDCGLGGLGAAAPKLAEDQQAARHEA